MKAILVVFLGLVALAAATNFRSQDDEMSQLKKLLLRALEKKVGEEKKADASQPKTIVDAHDNKQEKSQTQPSSIANSTATNQGPSQVKPATQKDETKPVHPQPAPTPAPGTQVVKDTSMEEIDIPQGPKPTADSKPQEKPEAAKPTVMPKPNPKPESSTQKPANATQKPANATHNATNATHKPSNATQKPHDAVQKPAVLPPHVGPSGAKPLPDSSMKHPADVVIIAEDKDEFVPAAPKREGMANLPISVLAFMMSSDAMKAAPLGTNELVVGIHSFDVILRHVIHTLRHVADDIRKAPSLASSAMQIERDMEGMARVFIPAQRRASAAFFRVMVYGLEERIVCDLESEDATDCVASRMQGLARLFTDPEHMDAEINKMQRCNHFVRDMSAGKSAVAEDMECIADGVTKVTDYLRKMKDTVSEIQLAGLLNDRPLPKYHMDLDDVEHEVADELQEQFKAIMSLLFRLMLDASELGRSLDS